MKKILISAVLLLSLALSMQAQKIGYMNLRALSAEMPAMAAASSELEVYAKQLQKQGEKMVSDLQTEYAALEARAQAGDLSPQQQEAEVEKFKVKQDNIGLFEQEMQMKVQKKEMELLQPILGKIEVAIKAVAEENGYQFIIDQSTPVLLFADENSDVSNLVRAKLGI
jgi:outer membrane protein